MKEIIKIWGAAVLVAVVGLLVAYNVGQDLRVASTNGCSCKSRTRP